MKNLKIDSKKKGGGYYILDSDVFEISKDSLEIFEIGATPLLTLMFQAGYLTIVKYDRDLRIYTLGYPNHEVRAALEKHLLAIFTQLDFELTERITFRLRTALSRDDFKQAVDLLKQFFARVPYQLHMSEEKFYHALLLMVFDMTGIKVQSELSTIHGRIGLIFDAQKKTIYH